MLALLVVLLGAIAIVHRGNDADAVAEITAKQDAALQQIAAADEQLAAKQAQIAALEKASADLAATAKQLEADNAALQSDLDDATGAARDAEQQAADALDEASQHRDTAAEANKQVDALAAQVESLNQEIGSLATEADRLSQQNSSLEQSNQDLAASNDKVTAQLTALDGVQQKTAQCARGLADAVRQQDDPAYWEQNGDAITQELHRGAGCTGRLQRQVRGLKPREHALRLHRAPARPADVVRLVEEAYARFRADDAGEVSTVYPALARVPRDLFGIAVTGVDGARHVGGRRRRAVLDHERLEAVRVRPGLRARTAATRMRELIGVNGTGLPFNSRDRHRQRARRPHQPDGQPGRDRHHQLGRGRRRRRALAADPGRPVALRRPRAEPRRGRLRARRAPPTAATGHGPAARYARRAGVRPGRGGRRCTRGSAAWR